MTRGLNPSVPIIRLVEDAFVCRNAKSLMQDSLNMFAFDRGTTGDPRHLDASPSLILVDKPANGDQHGNPCAKILDYARRTGPHDQGVRRHQHVGGVRPVGALTARVGPGTPRARQPRP